MRSQHSHAAGANNLRQIVGWAENDVRDDSWTKTPKLQFHAVIWGPGHDQIQDLPPLGTHTSGAATALNDRGQVVGISGRVTTTYTGARSAYALTPILRR